ncbi:MAG: methyltransferase [Candidatus Nitrohelix vancouverensis]|uniref:Methyltransferase n=1 Tax=Candidatus Nitrohelix vancouverensis TaxID=2705534 RepID=A0A7T0C561_9BACT|nr:MAG: methyltransferase [Candidatus Nitrohelix vancouverensis]
MDIEKTLAAILSGMEPACVLTTANSLGIFDLLEEAPMTAQQVAAKLNVPEKGVVRLLDALASLQLISKQEANYSLPEEAREYLTRNGARSMKDWIDLYANLMPVWLRLPTFIETGSQIQSIMEMLGSDPQRKRAFTHAMHDKALKATQVLARELPLSEARRMIDVGGGPGTYALEWCKIFPDLSATVFDIAPVLEIASEYIKKYHLEDRVDTRAGDALKGDFGSGYDLALVANILHMYSETDAQQILANVTRSLVPGGRIVIHGFCTDPGEIAPTKDVMFSLNIGMLTEGGRAHPVEEKIGWLQELGYQDIIHFRIDAMPTGVITALKAR